MILMLTYLYQSYQTYTCKAGNAGPHRILPIAPVLHHTVEKNSGLFNMRGEGGDWGGGDGEEEDGEDEEHLEKKLGGEVSYNWNTVDWFCFL